MQFAITGMEIKTFNSQYGSSHSNGGSHLSSPAPEPQRFTVPVACSEIKKDAVDSDCSNSNLTSTPGRPERIPEPVQETRINETVDCELVLLHTSYVCEERH